MAYASWGDPRFMQDYMQAYQNQYNQQTNMLQAMLGGGQAMTGGGGGYYGASRDGVSLNNISHPTKEETKVDKEILPDISLTRALKWAIVLMIALSLGQRVWKQLGPKIEAQLHKALGVE